MPEESKKFQEQQKMINVIVPIVENVDKFCKFIDSISNKDVKIFVGIKENLKTQFSVKNSNVEVKTFSNKSNKEEIINSLHSSNFIQGKILIVRRPLQQNEFDLLTRSSCEIATLKAKHNKFVSALKSFGKMIVKRFFAFSFFEDISAICYGESMFELLSVCANLSMASRINKYVGVEIEEFVTEEKPVKKEYNRWKNNLLFAFWTVFMLASFAGGILICIFVPVKILHVILIIFWMLVALGLWFVGIVNFTRTIAVGNVRYGRAEEI